MGNYENPFEFRRSWDVATEVEESVSVQSREQILEEKLNRLERTLQRVLENQAFDKASESTSKGKGKGKNTRSFLSRFRRTEDQISSHSDDSEERPPPYTENDESHGYGPPPGPVQTKKIYVKKVELLLNGAPLGDWKFYILRYFITYSQLISLIFLFSDQLDCSETQDECCRTFWKLFYNTGFTEGLFTNGIR